MSTRLVKHIAGFVFWCELHQRLFIAGSEMLNCGAGSMTVRCPECEKCGI
jgi:hypothetical protein